MSEFYWPSRDNLGVYDLVHDSGATWKQALWTGDVWVTKGNTAPPIDQWEAIAIGYLGVRREPAKPITEDDEDDAMGEREILEAAQQALDEWRTIQHKPAEVERWAYRWAVELCERLGAR